jgi:hypothetical protein
MSCILRIFGEEFNIDDLSDTELEVDSVWRKGDPRFVTKPEGDKLQTSGVSYLISNAEFEEFDKQIVDAIKYLRNNKSQIRSVTSLRGVEGSSLDFGIVWRDVAVQCDHFPAELVKEAGELGLGMELSQYPPSEENVEESEHADSLRRPKGRS